MQRARYHFYNIYNGYNSNVSYNTVIITPTTKQ